LDPYRVLHVHSSAPQVVVRAAYHALARLYHPDLNGGSVADERMAELNKAYAMVSTEAKRAAWAHQQNAGASMKVAPSAAAASAGAAPVARAPDSASGRRRGGLQQAIQDRWAQGATTAAAGPDRSGVRMGGSEPVVMDYGRYEGWRLEDIAQRDREYLEWLVRSPAGRRYRPAIDRLLHPVA